MSATGSSSYDLRETLRRNVMRRRRRRTLAGFTLIVIIALLTTGSIYLFSDTKAQVHDTSAKHHHSQNSTTTTSLASSSTSLSTTWRIAWGSAMAWGYGLAYNTTVREIVTTSIPGIAIRVRISNQWGNTNLDIGEMTVAQDISGANINPQTLVQATFNGSPTAVIPPGQTLLSDPINITVTANESLAISLWVTNSDIVTLHPTGVTDVSFFTRNNAGNLTTIADLSNLTYASPKPRWVDALEVLQPTSQGGGSIVVIGDSITDGFKATLNWVQVLQERIDQLPINERIAVVNEAITANTLTNVPGSDALKGGGAPGLSRLDVDALTFPGVSTVIIFLGTNDLYFGASAQQVIQGLQQAAAMIHQAGLKALVATLTPRMTTTTYPWSSYQQQNLQEVDQWILSNKGVFDGVLNFAPVLSDTYNGNCSPTKIFPPFNSGDNLHPNAAGQTAMGDSVQASLLGLQNLVQVPQLVTATPTPDCNGVEGIMSSAELFNG